MFHCVLQQKQYLSGHKQLPMIYAGEWNQDEVESSFFQAKFLFWGSKESNKRCEVLDMVGWWSSTQKDSTSTHYDKYILKYNVTLSEILLLVDDERSLSITDEIQKIQRGTFYAEGIKGITMSMSQDIRNSRHPIWGQRQGKTLVFFV